MPYWEDTEPRLSPDGTHRRLRRPGPASGSSPPRAGRRGSSSRAASPVWLGDDRLVVSVERDGHVAARGGRRRRPVAAAPRARRRTASSTRYGDEGGAAVSPDGARGRVRVHAARTTSTGARSASPTSRPARCAALTGTPASHDTAPAWSPDGAHDRLRLGAQRLVRAAPRRRATAAASGSSRAPSADFAEHAWQPDGDTIAAVRCRRNRFDLVTVDAADGAADGRRRGRRWGAPALDGRRARSLGTYEDHATPPELRLVAPGGSAAHAARPGPACRPRARRTSRPRTSRSRPSTASRSRRSCSARASASAERAGARGRLPARRPDRAATATSGTATRSTSSTRATPGSRSTSAARPATAATSSGSTTASGAWATRRTASPPPTTCARSTGSTASGSASSARATARTWRCSRSPTTPSTASAAPCRKYGDCDILTSWAQGDRDGVQDLERMMGAAVAARARPTARARPFHRLANVEVPLLIAHGERDERVSPKQSEELVAELRRLRQDVRVRDLPDRGARLPARRPAARLLPPPRAVPRLVPDVRPACSRCRR